MTGELVRWSVRRRFVVQVVNIKQWSEGYNPPRLSRGRGFLHFRLGPWEVRMWKALT